MCTNYRPSARDLIQWKFGLIKPTFVYPDETYPGYTAPIIVRSADDPNSLECKRAVFGLIPFWAKDEKIARQTYNARSETVASKPSYRGPWSRGQTCLVPMTAFYEPNYEAGKPIRWRIERADHEDFAVAAIWDRWKTPGGEMLMSFSMLTVNADGHALMARFHAPGDEKRSIVVVPPSRYHAWLSATATEATRFLETFDAGAFVAQADPRPPRTKKPPQ